VIRLIIRAKGIDHTLLITDSIRAAGLEDGDYDLGCHTVYLHAGIARTEAGGLAGSTLTLNQAVRNVMKLAGLSTSQALAMATRVPAEIMGLTGKKGILQPGADADVILLDTELNVLAGIVAGYLIFDRIDK
jgi:N-acetylglucosamine-6-phosphate deacetylase